MTETGQEEALIVRAFFAILAAIVVSGCVSSETMRFTAVSVSDPPSGVRILKEGAIGEDCPKGAGSYGSYADATRKAIESVPDANILINARFSRVEKPVAKICVKVTGDAAKL